MPKLVLLTAATALLLAAAAVAPLAQATTPIAPAGIGVVPHEATLVEQARMACTHRRVCRQGAGCAWRKVCKRW
jgi:hypothetical protein